MKRSLCLSFFAVLFAVSIACSPSEPAVEAAPTPTEAVKTEAPEETVSFGTPTPEPIRSVRVQEKTDAKTLTAELSALPDLESVEIDAGMLSNAEIASLIASFPNVAFRYEVKVGSLFVSPDVTELSVTEPDCTANDIAEALPYLPALETVHLGACTPEQLIAAADALSGIHTDFTVSIYGISVSSDAEELDLSETADPDPNELLSVLPVLPNLRSVVLGDREDPAIAADFRAAFPGLSISCRYRFTYKNLELNESTETLDLTGIPIRDVDELRRVLSWLPNLKHTEMVGCKLDNETMAALRDEFPEKGIVWAVYLGYWGKLRTDATAFTTRSRKTPDEMRYRLTSGSASPIRYCTELVALDLGHQQLDDISFLSGLTKLQVLILADNQITDITPLASMPDLVYVELFMNRISDLSPLTGLKNLKDLNICTNRIRDISPLYSLTSLERLWYSRNYFSQQDHEALAAYLSNCVCNNTVFDETDDGWREHERYFWMRAFFADSPRYK